MQLLLNKELLMPAKRRLTMRQLRQLLRLSADGVSVRDIAERLGIARSTVQDSLARAKASGLSWPLPGELTDDVLERRLFARSGCQQGLRRLVEPDWGTIAVELKNPGVTLLILWEEYRAIHPDGYGYSRFCELWRGFEQRLSPTMRQVHEPGDKVFVDYSGKKFPIVDRNTGEVREAEIFIGVLGASSYTFAEATWTQTLPDWIGSHVRMFRFYQGCPRLCVPDNLKSGVNKASFYDPEINRTYGKMACHYAVGILPAKAARPRYKAKVEGGVRIAQSYILGRLRNLTFFCLEEANEAIAKAVEQINTRIMRHVGQSRQSLFETVERPALGSLPTEDFEFAEWRFARVATDYHVEFDGYYYSVPYTLLRQQVEIRATSRTIEVFLKGQRVAAHPRRYGGDHFATKLDHMPSSHRRFAEWSPQRFQRWGASIGPHTEGLIIAILASRKYPEQGFRSCLGVLRLYNNIPVEQAEAVSARAVEINGLSSKSVNSLIKTYKASKNAAEPAAIVEHSNLRGSSYFH
jgi:transposase